MSSNVIRYSNDGTSLQHVPAITTILIKSQATSIKGVSKEVYAFSDASKTIQKVEFESGSKMESISPFCFYECRKLSEISLAGCTSLTSIGEYAFTYCDSLKTIKLPESLSTLEQFAFYRSGLFSIEIPNSVTSIGHRCFAYCYHLITFTIKDACLLSTIGGCVFTESNLTSFHITDNIVSFTGSAFEYNKNIATITVSKGNTHFVVDDNVLYNTNKTILYFAAPQREIPTFKVPDTVVTIETCAFHTSSLQGVTFSSKLKEIFSWAFVGAHLTELEIPGNCKKIYSHAFDRCSNLSKVTINEGVERIDDLCFFNCFELKEAKMPASLISFGGMCFPITTKLIFPDNSKIYIDDQNLIIDRTGPNLYQCFAKMKSVKIPDRIKYIRNRAFFEISSIENVTFTDNSLLTTIDDEAFRSSGIVNIKIPPTVTKIRKYAFAGCSKLLGLELGPSLNQIDYNAFEHCSGLTKLVFAVSDVGVSISNNVFYGCFNIESVEFNDRITDIGEYCFYKCEKIPSITLSAKLTKIDGNAFYGCGIKNLIIDGSSPIQTIEVRTFCNCHKLSEIMIPETITAIKEEAFAYTALDKITLPNGVETIGEMCFQGCSLLTEMTIKKDSNLKDIKFGAFDQCLSFKTIHNNCPNFEMEHEALFNKGKTELIILPPNSSTKYFSFPPSLKIVRITALQSCKNLLVIFIPDSVTTIMSYGFSGCSNLRSINIPKECVTIESNAFAGCVNLQCGISVENEDQNFRQNLINVAKMPRKAINDCNFVCTLDCKNEFKVISSCLFVLFIN